MLIFQWLRCEVQCTDYSLSFSSHLWCSFLPFRLTYRVFCEPIFLSQRKSENQISASCRDKSRHTKASFYFHMLFFRLPCSIVYILISFPAIFFCLRVFSHWRILMWLKSCRKYKLGARKFDGEKKSQTWKQTLNLKWHFKVFEKGGVRMQLRTVAINLAQLGISFSKQNAAAQVWSVWLEIMISIIQTTSDK